MATSEAQLNGSPHSHVFLGAGHEKSERRTWAVILLRGAMMIAEIVGGLLFGSIDDLHLWRLGPGHLGAIVSVATTQPRSLHYYRAKLARFPSLSHVTIEVEQRS